MLEPNQIICGDCLEVMKEWPDNCVDLVLTDPPYGIGAADWDSKPLTQPQFNEIRRIGRNQIIWGMNYFEVLPPTNAFICWYKRPFLKTSSQAELAWTSLNIKARVIDYTYAGNCEGENILKVDYKKKAFHIAEKPVAMLYRILEKFSQTTDIICDMFCGVGSTCIAAKMLGRRYIGIDISEKYCEIARQRLKAVDTGVPVKEQRTGQRALFEN